MKINEGAVWFISSDDAKDDKVNATNIEICSEGVYYNPNGFTSRIFSPMHKIEFVQFRDLGDN